jgi:hypothetical protein
MRLFTTILKVLQLTVKITFSMCGHLWSTHLLTYEGVSTSFWTGCLEWELQIIQLSATRCSCIAVLWVSLVSFTTINFCVASWVIQKVSLYFVIDWVWKLMDTPLYTQFSVLTMPWNTTVNWFPKVFSVLLLHCSECVKMIWSEALWRRFLGLGTYTGTKWVECDGCSNTGIYIFAENYFS